MIKGQERSQEHRKKMITKHHRRHDEESRYFSRDLHRERVSPVSPLVPGLTPCRPPSWRHVSALPWAIVVLCNHHHHPSSFSAHLNCCCREKSQVYQISFWNRWSGRRQKRDLDDFRSPADINFQIWKSSQEEEKQNLFHQIQLDFQSLWSIMISHLFQVPLKIFIMILSSLSLKSLSQEISLSLSLSLSDGFTFHPFWFSSNVKDCNF